MHLITILLSVVLVLNAAFLLLLILIQLPKKDAGAGLAFGAGATDALFGAGSGNALTKMTKYAAGVFLGLVLTLSFLSQKSANQSSIRIQQELNKRKNAPVPIQVPAAATAKPDTNAPVTIELQSKVPALTNQAAPSTNSATVPAAK